MALLSIFILLPSLLGAGVSGAIPQQCPLGEARRGRVTYLVYPDRSMLIQASFVAPPENISAWMGEAEASIHPTGKMSLSMNLTETPLLGGNLSWNATDLVLEGHLSGGRLLFSGNGSSETPSFPIDWGSFASFFPLSTLILSLDLRNSSVGGSILVPTGVAQSNLEVELRGNWTALTFHGMMDLPYGIFVYRDVTYNITYSYLNAACHYVFKGLMGRDEGSLYSLTHGALEVVDFNYTLEDKSTYASIDFEMETLGDFLRVAEWLFLGGEDEDFHRLLNATYASVEEMHLDMAYVGDLNKTYFSVSCSLEAERLAGLPFLLLPSELGKPLSLLIGSTLSSVEDLNISLSCLQGTLEARAEGSLNGGFEAVANDLKFDLAEEVLGELSPWERSFLEDTWFGTPGLKIHLCFNQEEVRMMIENLSLRPLGIKLENDSFTISGVFNFTDFFLPKVDEAFTIVVSGMHNSTHYVTPMIPEGVPQPDESPSANTLVWWNCTASSLSPLLFRVDRDKECPRAYAGEDLVAVQGAEVIFNASGSKDNLEVSTYLWDFGDGGNASGMIVRHRYTEGGDYTVVLTVRDAAGDIGVDSVKVLVLKDSDGDGEPDITDTDDDDDGWPDPWDLWGSDPLLPNLLVPPLTLILALLAVGGTSKRGLSGFP